jgi:hypothetical protein
VGAVVVEELGPAEVSLEVGTAVADAGPFVELLGVGGAVDGAGAFVDGLIVGGHFVTFLLLPFFDFLDKPML